MMSQWWLFANFDRHTILFLLSSPSVFKPISKGIASSDWEWLWPNTSAYNLDVSCSITSSNTQKFGWVMLVLVSHPMPILSYTSVWSSATGQWNRFPFRPIPFLDWNQMVLLYMTRHNVQENCVPLTTEFWRESRWRLWWCNDIWICTPMPQQCRCRCHVQFYYGQISTGIVIEIPVERPEIADRMAIISAPYVKKLLSGTRYSRYYFCNCKYEIITEVSEQITMSLYANVAKTIEKSNWKWCRMIAMMWWCNDIWTMITGII